MYIECQSCDKRKGNICIIDNTYAELNHIYAINHCTKKKRNIINRREGVRL